MLVNVASGVYPGPYFSFGLEEGSCGLPETSLNLDPGGFHGVSEKNQNQTLHYGVSRVSFVHLVFKTASRVSWKHVFKLTVSTHLCKSL